MAFSLSKAGWNEQVRAAKGAPHPFDHQGGRFRMELMDRADRLKRLRFRAWHRGTKEADLMIGGFFDRCSGDWSDAELEWFERLLEEQDVDIMAWAIGTQPSPASYQGEMMRRLQTIDYIKHPE